MKNIFDQFDLFCFDFDGLLVDSEQLHKTAYEQALSDYDLSANIDFFKYASFAHHAQGNQLKSLYTTIFPTLSEKVWAHIKKKKQKHYSSIIQNHPLTLMPGANKLIETLLKKNKAICVVTNSSRKDISPFKNSLPILNEIPLWITANDVQKSKPHPDGYITALVHYAEIPAARTIGFEDALKGVTAMRNASITPLLVCDHRHPQLSLIDKDLEHIESLETLLRNSS